MKVSSLLCFVCILALIGTASALTFINYTTNTTDASLYRTKVNVTFTDLRNGAGTAYDSAGTYATAYIRSDIETERYARLYRAAFIFDTSGLPDDAAISAATVGLYRYSGYTELGDTGINIVKFNIDGSFSNDDYDNFETARYSTDQNASTITTAKYYNFSLNTLGIENISKTGNTGLGSRFGFDIDNLSPTWVSGGSKYSGVSWRPADYVTYPPFIEIEYTLPTPTPTATPTEGAIEDWESCFSWCGIQEIFFWNASSDVSGYKILDHMPEKSVQREVNVTISAATGSQQLGAWVSPAGTPGVTTIAPGMWRFRTYHNVSSQVGITTLEFHIVNRSSTGVETDLFYGNAITKDINTLDPAEQLLSYARRNVTTMFDGDRLVIKVNATTTSVTARTVYMWLGGNTNTSMVQASNFICCEGGGCNTGSEGIAILFGVVGGILGAIAILRRRGEAP